MEPNALLGGFCLYHMYLHDPLCGASLLYLFMVRLKVEEEERKIGPDKSRVLTG